MNRGPNAERPDGTVELLLQGLKPESRACLILKDIEDFSHEEIAEMLGVAPGTVMSRVSRAREEVRENYLRLKDSGKI